jgi:hypothetical protein
MDATIKNYLSGLIIEEPQRHKNMSVFPLWHLSTAAPIT